MVNITIICLIYKSRLLLEAVYNSLIKHTPMLHDGRAELLFVANDATDEVIDYLKEKKLNHVIFDSEKITDEDLFAQGFGKPEYMRRVYRGYNYGIKQARGQRVVLINSDNFFSADWLENLVKYSEYNNVISSTLIEPGNKRFEVFPLAIWQNFGETLANFKEEEFLKFADQNRKTGLKFSGAFMPCILYKDVAIQVGLYPEGNIAGKSFDDIKWYGDEYFFKKLKDLNIHHYTASDSLVYHLKEGEKSEQVSEKYSQRMATALTQKTLDYPLTKYEVLLLPSQNHRLILNTLLRKVVIIVFESGGFENQFDIIKKQTFKNYEVIIIKNDPESIVETDLNVISLNLVDVNQNIDFLRKRLDDNYYWFLDGDLEYELDFLEKSLEEIERLRYLKPLKKELTSKSEYRGLKVFSSDIFRANAEVLYVYKWIIEVEKDEAYYYVKGEEIIPPPKVEEEVIEIVEENTIKRKFKTARRLFNEDKKEFFKAIIGKLKPPKNK